jgi:hypothetical protein
MKLAGTRNEICVSLVYSGNVNEILFPFPLYTRETQISFLVPGNWKSDVWKSRISKDFLGIPLKNSIFEFNGKYRKFFISMKRKPNATEFLEIPLRR